MIKSVTTSNIKDVKRNVREMSADVTVEGTAREIIHEFMGILDALQEQCPDVLLIAIRTYTEGLKHDC